MPQRANYGIDAPTAVRTLLVGGGALMVLVALVPAAKPLAGAAVGMTFGGLLMLSASKVGKIRFAKRAVARLGLAGDEQVLDVGCGHGLMLITAAKHLTTGRAVGVDIWSQRDQASNRPEATLRNAQLEGVRDRVEVRDGDARKLPFDNASFDVIVSSLVIHNISDRAGRAQALREMARVLKPGGRVAIIDIVRTGEYARVLRGLGFRDMRHGPPSFMWGAPMRLLTGTRP